MSELETLRARLRELELQVEAGAREVREARVSLELAEAHVATLREYLKPAVAREAILNIPTLKSFDAALLDGLGPGIWNHIAPAYKLDELSEAALRALRGGR